MRTEIILKTEIDRSRTKIILRTVIEIELKSRMSELK